MDASLEDLLLIIGDQQVTISLLRAKIAALEAKLADTPGGSVGQSE